MFNRKHGLPDSNLMGCGCAAEREKEEGRSEPKAKASPDTAPPQQFTKSREQPTPQLGLVAGSAVTPMAGRFEERYRVISQMKPWKGNSVVVAEYVTTRKPCIIVTFPKRGLHKQETKNKIQAFEAMMKFDHPHIRKIYEVVRGNNEIHLVVEQTDAELVDYMHEKSKMKGDIAGKVAAQLLSVMCYVHSLGEVHGRLRPDCIGFQTVPETEVNVKVSAFFSNEWTKNEELSIFEAPEVRSQHITPASDIWSCGVLLYYVLIGKLPYKTVDEVGRAKLAFERCVSPEAVILIKAMLMSRPEDRPDASSCLASPWIRSYTRNSLKSREVHQHLRNLCAQVDVNSLRKAVWYFIVDRIVPQGEIAQVAKTFVTLDTNADGLLSKEELLTGLRVYMTETAAQTEVERILASACSTDVVDYSAFVVAALGCKVLLSDENLKAAFRSLDADDSGRISLNELKKVFRVETGDRDEAVWRGLLEQVDTSGDGEIDEKEFRNLMRLTAEQP